MNDIAERLVRKQTKNEADLDYLMFQLEKVELFKNMFQYSSMKMSKDFLESLEAVRIPKAQVIFTENQEIDGYSYLVLKGQIIILSKQGDKLNRKEYFDSLIRQFKINNPQRQKQNQFVEKSIQGENNFSNYQKTQNPLMTQSAVIQDQDTQMNLMHTLQVKNNQFEQTAKSNTTSNSSIQKSKVEEINNANISQCPNKQIFKKQNQTNITSEQDLQNKNIDHAQLYIQSITEQTKRELMSYGHQFGKYQGLVYEGNLFGEESIQNFSIKKKKFYSYTAIAGCDCIIALVNTQLVSHILKKIDQKFNIRVQKIQNGVSIQGVNFKIQKSEASKQKAKMANSLNTTKNYNFFNSQNQTHSSFGSPSPIRQSRQQFEQIDKGYQRNDDLYLKMVDRNKKVKKNQSSNDQAQKIHKDLGKAYPLQNIKQNNSYLSDKSNINQAKMVISSTLQQKQQLNTTFSFLKSQQYFHDLQAQRNQFQTRIHRSLSPPCSRQEFQRRLQVLIINNEQSNLDSVRANLSQQNNLQANQMERKNRTLSPFIPQKQKDNLTSMNNRDKSPYQQFYQQTANEAKISPRNKNSIVKKVYVSKTQNYVMRNQKSIRELYENQVQLDKSISYSNFLQNNQNNQILDRNNISNLVVSASSIKSKN
ncbi:hypothetical protein TTHERM_01004970 (macronuclear) [Tetrahymena thermophila SB210]|uniref:Cyclic nucleotide-binding domain protein n=1 Tax=Tetrahymena thermophila (strain SB210) TaxID=312017 RepID=Q22XU9_TETTS|nr:hypothetical protein TTHERM_01004970 [Tetrahymena thermophila SB210]EAR90072.2 hypothetical protein TTHERM_01004970 [Tetrahymena thermophila SB210]|eukprot:XP_001010317.2 hypothetical protein TTHERM_01004970 [Tetrahymena thermophila SB210]